MEKRQNLSATPRVERLTRMNWKRITPRVYVANRYPKSEAVYRSGNVREEKTLDERGVERKMRVESMSRIECISRDSLGPQCNAFSMQYLPDSAEYFFLLSFYLFIYSFFFYCAYFFIFYLSICSAYYFFFSLCFFFISWLSQTRRPMKRPLQKHPSKQIIYKTRLYMCIIYLLWQMFIVGVFISWMVRSSIIHPGEMLIKIKVALREKNKKKKNKRKK